MALRQKSQNTAGAKIPTLLLKWYDAHARDLPWRALPGQPPPNPYHVWLSEIMLQQTTVPAVKPYFEKFLRQWPRVQDLAVAPLEQVLQAWAGLGYYARARNLHKGATVLADLRAFPQDEAELRKIPGIGPYTAAAISSIAFGRRAVVVDGNVERVIARLYRLETPLPAAKPEIYALADALTPTKHSGDFAQAMMDLGATICTPRNPKCTLCPVQKQCAAVHAPDVESYPKKMPKKARPLRYGHAFIVRTKSHVYLQRRPSKGLLASMAAVPSSDWLTKKPLLKPILAGKWQHMSTPVNHVFTHFQLFLDVHVLHINTQRKIGDGWWHPIADLQSAGLPSVFRKVMQRADLL